MVTNSDVAHAGPPCTRTQTRGSSRLARTSPCSCREACGPRARWTLGWFAVDFVREDDGWKIWHMQYLYDILRLQGDKWYGEEKKVDARPEFQGIEDVKLLPPTKPEKLRALYNADRPFAGAPRRPEPYHTFAETFSYGL